MKKRQASQGRGWKYAFFLLLFFNVSFLGWAYLSFFSSKQDSGTADSYKKPIHTSMIEAEVTLEEVDLEALLFNYLVETEQNPITNVEVKEDVLLKGELQILGFPVEYLLQSKPFAMENGDIQLKVEEITLGSLSLPISQVLQLLTSQLSTDLPIRIDSKEKRIYILLTEIHNEVLSGIKLLKIDKEKQEYTFGITMNKEYLLQ